MRLKVRNGNFRYGASQILRQVSFDLEGNQVLAVLEPNGVGKITLLKCMMGLLKWDSGESRIDGIPMNTLKHSEIWKRITYVPQSKGVSLSYTAPETVVMGRSVRLGFFAQPSREDMEMAKVSMEKVGITFLMDKPCSQMSGGEFQMILIARALCTQPEMLILDGPESNLDSKNQLVILDMIRRLSSNQGIGAIINAHYPAHALKIADKVLILNRDKNSFYGGAGETITEDNMKKVFAVGVKTADYYYEDANHLNVIPVRALSSMSSHSL